MINKVNLNPVNTNYQAKQSEAVSSPYSNQSNVVSFEGSKTSATKLASAYQALHGIQTAKSVNFTGGLSLQKAFADLDSPMVTCADPENGRQGEPVGSRVFVTELVDKFADQLPKFDDAIKTSVDVATSKNDLGKEVVTEARTQIKNKGLDVLYQMAVRQPRVRGTAPDLTKPLKQDIQITLTPSSRIGLDTNTEKAYVLNTKGNLMAVVEDEGDVANPFVLMTDTGEIKKKTLRGSTVLVDARKASNTFTPFAASVQEVRDRSPQASVGKGTEIVIGMEDGRFVPEIIQSIAEFEEKVNNGEIVLDTFVAAPDADNTQIAMLAGGFGSRAEYTNASSDGIFHGVINGAQSTKGVFRTPTGLTPMETTFITLHNAGLLDCSKGNFGIGKNVKFYLNKSGVNKGNGGFTVDLYDKMARSGRENLFIFPNDPLSRVTEGVKKANEIMNSGKAAMVMIAKEIDPADAYQFGIMRLGEDNEIKAFVEKPKNVDDSLVINGKCVANTFQFSVSKEAFEALDALAPFFPAGKGKEPRDWSKCFTPVLMNLTQKDDLKNIQKSIAAIVETEPENIPLSAIQEAKDILGDQKIIAVPTDEPWADCGTLNALYHTTMQIASGDFPLEDFERAHVLESVNTETGLVATTPELKDAVESKYGIKGQVMVAPQAQKVSSDILSEYADAITINPPAKKA